MITCHMQRDMLTMRHPLMSKDWLKNSAHSDLTCLDSSRLDSDFGSPCMDQSCSECAAHSRVLDATTINDWQTNDGNMNHSDTTPCQNEARKID
jgi:hypothetical protein